VRNGGNFAAYKPRSPEPGDPSACDCQHACARGRGRTYALACRRNMRQT
jgi:hypothetical protein